MGERPEQEPDLTSKLMDRCELAMLRGGGEGKEVIIDLMRGPGKIQLLQWRDEGDPRQKEEDQRRPQPERKAGVQRARIFSAIDRSEGTRER